MRHMRWSYEQYRATPDFYIDVLLDLLEEQRRQAEQDRVLQEARGISRGRRKR